MTRHDPYYPLIGSNRNLSRGNKSLEQSCDILLDHVGRSAIPAPYCYLRHNPSRMSGPANEIVGEKAKLFRCFQALKNNILIGIQVQNLRFLFEMVKDRGGDPRSSELANPVFCTDGSTFLFPRDGHSGNHPASRLGYHSSPRPRITRSMRCSSAINAAA